MTIRRILLHVRSTTQCVCKVPIYDWRTNRNFFKCRQGQNRILATNFPLITNTQFTQNYVKSMDKPKSSGKKKTELREDIVSEYFNVDRIKMEMNDVVEYMKEQFLENVSVRSGSGTIESIVIEHEGTEYMIRDLAQVNRKNPKVVVLNFSAFPQTIPTVLQTLNDSGLNLNPQQDGTTVFIPIPKVTREHREKLAKSANAVFVKCKAAVREVQIKFMKKLELRAVNEKISVEKMRLLQEQLTLLADSYIAEMEKLKNEKVKELLRDE